MKNGNESAFAYGFANEQSHQEVIGLTKREYFAAMATQGMLGQKDIHSRTMSQIASDATKLADALLKELEKSE